MARVTISKIPLFAVPLHARSFSKRPPTLGSELGRGGGEEDGATQNWSLNATRPHDTVLDLATVPLLHHGY